MTPTHLQQWILHPENLDRETLYELRTLLARYPYFQSLRLLYLKNLYLLHDSDFGAELRKSVFYVADRQVLFYLIEGFRYQLSSSQKNLLDLVSQEDTGIDRTLSLIDAFLATVPEEQTQEMNLDISVDYTSYLLGAQAEENETNVASVSSVEEPRLRAQELVDGFIRQSELNERTKDESVKNEEIETPDEERAENLIPISTSGDSDTETASGEGCFTETLAKIYIKQQRYEKALEIIKKLSLNYPKKNAYFADQIRFLEKLIINAKSK